MAVGRLVWIGLLALLASVGLARAEMQSLTVSAAYLERIALPPDAQLEVELLDTSRMDVAAIRIASQRVAMTRIPMRVALPYDPAVIDARMTYTVAARIHSEGRVVFRTTQAYPVLTRGAGQSVDLILQQAGAVSPLTTPKLTGISWQLVALDGVALDGDVVPTLELRDGGGASVFAGCNRFSGRVEIAPGAMVFPSPMAGTKMACPPPLDTLERDVIAALEATRRFAVSGGFADPMLRLLDEEGEETALFAAAPR
ncbi:YbaY family lipoprotein [Dinoroseobacter sp. S76]|uniref:YbaY family lipoprotein n=1 Tax=Dinoroseobacter sp. S76 TaxID=3415124 RepID=UPI003C7B3BAC